jgi:hypothetical protein
VILAAALLLLLLCGGAAAAYVIASRPVADVHNGLSEPFTSAAKSTSSAPATTTGGKKQPDGAPWPMYGRNASHNRDAAEMTGVAPPYTRVWKKPGHGVLEYPPSYVNGVLYLAADSGWVGATRAPAARSGTSRTAGTRPSRPPGRRSWW